MDRPTDTVSVVIRVRNAEQDLFRCLSRLSEQVLPPNTELQIVVVDNESSDGSVRVAREYAADICTIRTNEFSWGRALNRGIAVARGKVVLLLSADAYPADATWLIRMIEPFRDRRVAAVYGRQLPRSDSPIDEQVRLARDFGRCSRRVDGWMASMNPSGVGMPFPLSNACAAIRREAWDALPYDELIQGGEEGVWTYEVLRRGCSVVYQGSARVFHSHRDGVLRWSWRCWELLRKNIQLTQGRNICWGDVCRAIASHAKHRCRNCFSRRVPVRSALAGVCRLPFEMLAFIVIWVLARDGDVQGKWRQVFWG